MAGWVCDTGRAVPNPNGDVPAYVCVDDDNQVIPGERAKPQSSNSSQTEVDGNRQIRPTEYVQLGGARELGVTDVFDRRDNTIKTSIDYAENLPNRLRAEEGGTGGRRYQELVQGLEGYFDQDFSSYTSIDTAWNRVVEDAKGGNRVAMDLVAMGRVQGQDQGQTTGGGGGGGAYTGPRYSVTEANEEDLYTMAQSLAMEMIGRPINGEQFDRVLKRVRNAERENPTVSRTVGNRTTTETGITNEGRQSVMAELLQENPDWRRHQMSQGVLDALTRNIQEAKRLDSGV